MTDSSRWGTLVTTFKIDDDAAINRFLKLAAIEGASGREKPVANYLVRELVSFGLERSQIAFDDAHQRSGQSGECGNLIVSLPGETAGPVTLLSAHMDTVPACVGSQPVHRGNEVISDSASGVGADNRGGCSVLLTAAVERLRCQVKNLPPARLVFTVQEETGLYGARFLDREMIGKVHRAINVDGASVDVVRRGAIGGIQMRIQIEGIASHAGNAPGLGVNASSIAAIALERLFADGWLGRIDRMQGTGTANVGRMVGGEATNVVMPDLEVHAEARSHDQVFRSQIVEAFEMAFRDAATQVRNVNGETGSVHFSTHVDYEPFELAEDHPTVCSLQRLLESLGRNPVVQIANGGLDANWLVSHGIEAVTIGCGQQNIHTKSDSLNVIDYLDACRIATSLLTEPVGIRASSGTSVAE